MPSFLVLLFRAAPTILTWLMYALSVAYPDVFPSVGLLGASMVTAANVVPSPLKK